MEKSKSIARISVLKGHAYLFYQNKFLPLKLNQELSEGAILLTDAECSLVLNFGNDSKQLMQPDTVNILQFQKSPLSTSSIARFERFIESIMPTTNGEARGRSGVCLTSLSYSANGNSHYICELIKPLSLAQVSALEKVARLSVDFKDNKRVKSMCFCESDLLKALVNAKIDAISIKQLIQPLYGQVSENEEGIFHFELDKSNDAIDLFSCVVEQRDGALLRALFCVYLVVNDGLVLRYIHSRPQRYRDIDVTSEDSIPEEIETRFTAVDDEESDETVLFEENDNDLNFIMPLTKEVSYVWNKNQVNGYDSETEVVSSFHEDDCIELQGISAGLEHLTDYLHIFTRESDNGINSIIEISGDGKLSEGRVNKVFIIADVDFTKGADNQEEIIDNMLASGTLVINSKVA